MSVARPLRVALYGDNGHQLHGGRALAELDCRVAAVAALGERSQAAVREQWPDVRVVSDLDQLIDLEPDLFVLCSPRRDGQAGEAVRCLEAGIAVYAEKPCATDLSQLERLEAAAVAARIPFHEMADTVFTDPLWRARRAVLDGVIGQPFQVLAQKSYPMHPGRSPDEGVDGGLVAQAGIHALRMVTHGTGRRVMDLQAVDGALDASFGAADCASIHGRLEGGTLFGCIVNYAHPRGFGTWGNDALRVWGSAGMLEAVDHGQRTRLVVGDEDRGPLPADHPPRPWLRQVVEHVRDGTAPDIDLAFELHPTRIALLAAAEARRSRSSRIPTTTSAGVS